MPFDGLFLKKLTDEFQTLIGGKISKVLEVSDTDYIFNIRANYKNLNLLISLSNEYYRIHLTTKSYEYPKTPKSFTMLLRKHLEGSIIKNITTYKNDRILILEVQGLNEIGDLEGKKVIIELTGKFSNMILTQNNIIIDAYKKENSIDEKRIIFPNATYQFIDSNKLDPYTLSKDEIIDKFKNIKDAKEISNTFNGISLLTSNYVLSCINPSDTFYDLINSSIKPISFNFKNKIDYYFKSIGYDEIKHYETLSLMLDDIYFDKALKENIKQKSNDLYQFIIHNIKKLNDKLNKLNVELDEALNNDLYRLYGELLIANSYVSKKSNEIKVLNYYNNEYITIPLDIRYNIIDNSKIYFKKYQKSKNAIKFIEEQIEKTKDDINYFNLLKVQVEHASLSDILEIVEELNKAKYINTKKKKEKKTKSKILTYTLDNGTIIYVGKNNIQNELITHKLSKPNEMWFHVKGFPGSHVVVKKDSDLTETEIRTAAMIASFYSPASMSSSVAVNYTKIRYIKKIPGKRSCFVTFTNEKTIYIDPSKDFIDSLKSNYITV